MGKKHELKETEDLAAKFDADIRALTTLNTPNARAVRRAYSRRLRHASSKYVMELAFLLMEKYDHRWAAYELIREHEAAFRALKKKELEELGHGINSWWTVDSFARTLSGPVWLNRQVSDAVIHGWARSKDRWWRRAALVSTVALNVRSKGGYGDDSRTLAVCTLLVHDHDDMVVKALSWALRELAVHYPKEVSKFLRKHEAVLAARVIREVRNKLKTGLKNPKAGSA
jgi:3-methyladenine DNA glycosylase AlkD